MKLIKGYSLYRLFSLLSQKRKNEIYFLLILLIVNGISESIAVITVAPFLSLIISGEGDNKYSFINKYLPTYISNYSEKLFYLTIIFCIFILISVLIRIFNSWYILRLTAKINIELSNNIFENNIYQSYLYYSKKNSSNTISLILDKVTACASALNSVFTILLGIIVSLFIVVPLTIYSWKIIFLSFLILFIYYFLIAGKVKKRLFNNGRIKAINSPIRIKIIQESFMGFRDIIINGTEKIYLSLFNKYNSITQYKLAESQFLITIPKFIIEGTTLLIIVIVGYRVSSSNFQNSNFIPLFGSFIYAFQRLLPLSQVTYASWAGYKVKAVSIADVLKELENNNHKKNNFKTRKLIFKDKIIFKKVSYSYQNNKKILNDVSLTINKGDHVGIYGETGSGKSTFLDIFMGLLPPEKGSIFVDKEQLFNNNSQVNWTSMIAHVPQTIFLKEGNIAENIAFGQSMKTLNYDLLEKSSKIAKIFDFIKEMKYGFSTLVGERGIRLSGGQRQRIAIARALYKRRSILVLDEATSALDEDTEKSIIDNILETHKNLTIIMVTHRKNSLKNCNRIFKVTNEGSLIEEQFKFFN